MRGPDQRAPSAAGTGSDATRPVVSESMFWGARVPGVFECAASAASVSLPHTGVSVRQRLGGCELGSGEAPEEIADRVHPEPGQSHAGQCAGGGQNGAIIRKHMATCPVIVDRALSRCPTPGYLRIAFRRYGHITAGHAEAVQKFFTAHLNPYLNFHRPCGFATVSLDAGGKRQWQ